MRSFKRRTKIKPTATRAEIDVRALKTAKNGENSLPFFCLLKGFCYVKIYI
jgi:hypothetical protein